MYNIPENLPNGNSPHCPYYICLNIFSIFAIENVFIN